MPCYAALLCALATTRTWTGGPCNRAESCHPSSPPPFAPCRTLPHTSAAEVSLLFVLMGSSERLVACHAVNAPARYQTPLAKKQRRRRNWLQLARTARCLPPLAPPFHISSRKAPCPRLCPSPVFLHSEERVLAMLHLDPSLLDNQLAFCGIAAATLVAPGLLLWAAHSAVITGRLSALPVGGFWSLLASGSWHGSEGGSGSGSGDSGSGSAAATATPFIKLAYRCLPVAASVLRAVELGRRRCRPWASRRSLASPALATTAPAALPGLLARRPSPASLPPSRPIAPTVTPRLPCSYVPLVWATTLAFHSEFMLREAGTLLQVRHAPCTCTALRLPSVHSSARPPHAAKHIGQCAGWVVPPPVATPSIHPAPQQPFPCRSAPPPWACCQMQCPVSRCTRPSWHSSRCGPCRFLSLQARLLP